MVTQQVMNTLLFKRQLGPKVAGWAREPRPSLDPWHHVESLVSTLLHNRTQGGRLSSLFWLFSPLLVLSCALMECASLRSRGVHACVRACVSAFMRRLASTRVF